MTDNDKKPVSMILGGTGSVGRSLATNLAEQGHQVVIGGRDQRKLAAVAEHTAFDTVLLDADQSGSIDATIADVAKKYGRITGIANCIGSILLKPAHLTSDEEFDDVLRTNLLSSFQVIRGAARCMRKHGGTVVLVSTAAASIGIPNHEAIAAAKAGVEGLARSAAATYARSGIRVNVVSPGLVKSEMSRNIWSNKRAEEASVKMHALGRLGEPVDIASLIAWLMTPANNWITGQVIGLDGGLSSVLQQQRL